MFSSEATACLPESQRYFHSNSQSSANFESNIYVTHERGSSPTWPVLSLLELPMFGGSTQQQTCTNEGAWKHGTNTEAHFKHIEQVKFEPVSLILSNLKNENQTKKRFSSLWIGLHERLCKVHSAVDNLVGCWPKDTQCIYPRHFKAN